MAKKIIGNSEAKVIAETVTISGSISNNNQAATKEYVDSVSDKKYTHNQIASSTIWNITHNLNKKPNVTVVDTGENVCIGEIEYISDNELKITFTYEFSGKAYLN
jgi:hypothetical protein